ncbi:unnamed protein product [Meloidogyne enterolobii]
MPHLFALNAFLREKRSPLTEYCYGVILEICRDHQEQLDDFLASDPQLKAEIRFDLRQTAGGGGQQGQQQQKEKENRNNKRGGTPRSEQKRNRKQQKQMHQRSFSQTPGRERSVD